MYKMDVDIDKSIDLSIANITELVTNTTPPSLDLLIEVLNRELSPHAGTLHITDITKKYKRLYNSDRIREFFSRFLTRIYFPKDNYCFICSHNIAEQIPIIKNIISGNWKVKAINLIYYDDKRDMNFSAGRLVICKADIAAILLPANTNSPNEIPKTLSDFIPPYY